MPPGSGLAGGLAFRAAAAHILTRCLPPPTEDHTSASNRERVAVKYGIVLATSLIGVTCDKSTGLKVGPPASVIVVSGQDQVDIVGHELPQPLAVKVTDAAKTPISGQRVVFKVTKGGGSVSAELVTTSENGVATTRWTLGTSTSESQVLEAQVVDAQTQQTLLLVEFHATAQPDGASSLEKTAGDNQTAAAGTAVGSAPTVMAVDQYSNPVSGKDVVWGVATGGGTVAGGATATSQTDASGVATPTGAWTLGPVVGNNTLTATVAGAPPVTFSASGVTGPPARLGFVVQPSAIATNGEILPRQPVIQLQDNFGNPVRLADEVVQITQIANSGAGTLQILNDTTRTDAQGIATFTGTEINGRVGDGYRLGFATPTTSTLASDPISLLRGQAFALSVVVPADGASRGSTLAVQPVIQSVDAGGNPAPTIECINVSISPGGTLTGGTQLSGGYETFMFSSVGIDGTTSPGTYTLTYYTGCCAPNSNIRQATQSIEVK